MNRALRAAAMLAVALASIACSYTTKPELASSAAFRTVKQDEFFSLFQPDASVYTDEEFERIYSAAPRVPEKPKLVVVSLNQPLPSENWLDELGQRDNEALAGFASGIQGSQRVGPVSICPALIMPKVRDLPNLRATVARFQADLMLVYYRVTWTSTRHRAYAAMEIKGETKAEAVLFDVRTGLILYSTIGDSTETTKVEHQDFGQGQALRRAEKLAVVAATERLSADIVNYLDNQMP
ncbi:hypothetical protein HZA57_09250 [Candidatus Poribacteria bacterium]|nr:hypothetical protein [Candidatus Poribacteria bacterium]